MKKPITLLLLYISLASFSTNNNQDLKSINESIFNGIKNNNLELLKPHFFNNDNIKLCKDAFEMTDEDIEKFRRERKAPYATHELLEKIRTKDDNEKINWEKTEFINVPKFNNIENLIPQKNKQAEIYTTYIPFSEGKKKWKLRVMYLKTEIGFFVMYIGSNHSEYKEFIISSNPEFEGKWHRPDTNRSFYFLIKKNGDHYILDHSRGENPITGSLKDGVLTFSANETPTTCIIDENDNLIMSTDNLISGMKLTRMKE